MLAPGAANLPTLDTDGALTAPALTLTGAATVGGALTVGTSMTLSAGVAALPAGTAAAPALKVGAQQNGLSAATANTLVASAGGTAIGTFSSTGLGTEVEGGWLLRERDCTQFMMACKQLMDHAARLRGVRVVEHDGVVVTTYHARPHKQRKLLRRDVKRRIRREGE